jgi:hypothetical protein
MKRPAIDYDERLSIRGEEPTYNEDGVDLTQIRRSLSLTPLERLIAAEQASTEIETLLRIMRVKDVPGGEH